MFYDYVQNITSAISDRIQLQHENRANEKDSPMCTGAAERNKKYELYENNNPNYDNDYGNGERVSPKKHSGISNDLKQARFLIAESEKELQSLFKAYLDLIGAESEIVDNGNRALSTFLRNKNEGKGYDAVV